MKPVEGTPPGARAAAKRSLAVDTTVLQANKNIKMAMVTPESVASGGNIWDRDEEENTGVIKNEGSKSEDHDPNYGRVVPRRHRSATLYTVAGQDETASIMKEPGIFTENVTSSSAHRENPAVSTLIIAPSQDVKVNMETPDRDQEEIKPLRLSTTNAFEVDSSDGHSSDDNYGMVIPRRHRSATLYTVGCPAESASIMKEPGLFPENATSSSAPRATHVASTLVNALSKEVKVNVETPDCNQEDIKPPRLSTTNTFDVDWSDVDSSDGEYEIPPLNARSPFAVMADSKVVPEATTSPYASKEYPSTFGSTHPLSHDSKLKSETLGPDQEDFKSLRLSTTIALDEDSSDDEDEIQFLKTRSPFAASADSKRENLLQALPLEEDKALQRLLWRMGFQFLLKGHQPTAVRRVAGVPPKFPLHYQPKMETLDISLCMLGLPARPPTRGILLADEMGLGKTIEAIAGMILYNGIQEHREREQRPCVVVTPNNAVLEQWVTALVKNGVSRARIFKFTKNMKIRHDRNDFILMEKSKLQTELKEIFEGIKDKNFRKTTSSLFPQATMDNFRALWVQYEASYGRVRNAYQFEKEAPDDCVRRLIGEMSRHYKPCFRTVVLDESHFLKNQLAYWGIAALLLTVHSERAIPMSGTPYNNSVQDLAAAMGYVDLHINPAKNDFWKRSLDVSCAAAVHSNLIDWKREYLVRRTKEQTLKEIGLKSKTIGKQIVEQHPNEIFLQEQYERMILAILKDFRHSLEENGFMVVQKQKRIYSILMASIASARMAAIHPILPGGRELTKRFSPSRRHLVSMEARPDACVCCIQGMRPSIPIPKDQKGIKDTYENRKIRQQRDIDLDDENLNDDEIDDIGPLDKNVVLTPLPSTLCSQADTECQHYAHAECIERMAESGDSCPRCQDTKKRLHLVLNEDTSGKPTVKYPVYCKHIEAIPGAPSGFAMSSKLNRIVEHIRNNIPADDKILVLSFFKASLDLLEGIFEDELQLGCSRFDGDLGPVKGNESLEDFKTNPRKRILLATVQSGGTGLNITQANHVLFIDRHFNPFTHEQAMDRCYRIGQEKDVFVEFFDAAGSVDECMRMLNEYKSQNSRVILADGTELGANTGGNLSYREISGLLSRALLGIAMCRSYNIQQNGRGALIPATHEQIIDHILTGEGNEVQRAMDDFVRGTRTIDETTARKPTLPATADTVSGST